VSGQSADAGITGGGGVSGIVSAAPDTPEFKIAQVEAQRAEKAIASATPAQVALMRWLASGAPNGVKAIPDAVWLENFMTATKDLTPEQVARLEQVEKEPAPDLTLEEMQLRLKAALAGGEPGKAEAEPTPEEQEAESRRVKEILQMNVFKNLKGGVFLAVLMDLGDRPVHENLPKEGQRREIFLH
jgi:hypothetical protein